MTIEATLNEIVTTLKAIHTALASGAAVSTTAEAAAPVAETKKTKADTKKPEAAAPVAPPVAAPAPAPAAKAADWKADVMPVLLEINKSTKPEHGRAGLLKIMSNFGLPDGSKVPDLEKLGKHDEVLAYAKGVLSGETAGAADDDLGI